MSFFQFCLKKKRKWIFQANTFESAMFSTIFYNPLCAAPVFLCIDINPQESVHVYALTFLRDLGQQVMRQCVWRQSFRNLPCCGAQKTLYVRENVLETSGLYLFIVGWSPKRIKAYTLFKPNQLVRIASYIYS